MKRARRVGRGIVVALCLVLAWPGGGGVGQGAEASADGQSAAAMAVPGRMGEPVDTEEPVFHGERVGLRQAMEEALENGPHVRLARARLAEAEASALASLAEVRGRLDGDVTAASFSTSPELSPAPVKGDQATGGITWTGHLWRSPDFDAAVAGAEATLAAARKEWRDAVIQVVQNTAHAYLDLLQAQEGVRVAQQRAAWAAEALDIVRQRHAQGQASSVELLEAESDYRQAEVDRQDARKLRELAMGQLQLWMARPSGSPVVAVDPLEDRDPFIVNLLEDLEGVISLQEGGLALDASRALARALDRRFDVQVARYQKEAVEARFKAVETGRRTRIGLSATYEWPDALMSVELNRWGQGKVRAEGGKRWLRETGGLLGTGPTDDEWRVGVQFGWILFDGGAQEEREREGQARIDAAQAGIDQLVPGIELEVDATAHEVERTMWIVEAAQLRLDAAVEGMRQAEQLHALQAAGEVDLLAARTRLEAARFEWKQARWQHVTAQLALAIATGWVPDGFEDTRFADLIDP